MVQIIAPPQPNLSAKAAEREKFEKAPAVPITDHLSIGPLSDVDSAAITQSAIENSEANSGPSSGNNKSDGDFATLAPPHESMPAQTSASATALADEANDYRREVEMAWQSESTQRTKQLVLIALLSCFGLATAGIVFSQFVRTWRAQQITAATPEPEPVLPSSEPSIVSPEGPPDSSEAVEPATTPDSLDAESVIANTIDSPLTEEPVVMPTDEVTPVASSPIPPLTTTPFDIAPSTEAMTSVRPRDAQTLDKDDVVPPMNSLPPGMLKFMPLLSLETTNNQAAPIIQPPPTIDSVRIDEAAAQEEPTATANPKRKPIDVQRALAQRFAIANNGASIAELMLLVSQLTTVPIELELISFDAANKRVDTPVQTPTGWMSARDWIDGLCASQGLVAQSFEDRLMISASESEIDAGIAPALRLDDFGDEATDVYRWISPLLLNEQDEEPAEDTLDEDLEVTPMVQTSLSDDGRSIVPGPSLRSRMRAVFAIESVRLMRGMPLRLERWRTLRWIGPWPEKDNALDNGSFGDWALVDGGDGGLRLDSPRTVAGMIRSIASLNQTNALVGWLDATQQDFYPNDLMMPYSRQGTASSMLDEILGEQNLQARICGPALWYIGTEASYDRFEVLTWIPIPLGNADAIRKRLMNSLAIQDAADMPVAFDEKWMLIRCPRYIARQLHRIVDP